MMVLCYNLVSKINIKTKTMKKTVALLSVLAASLAVVFMMPEDPGQGGKVPRVMYSSIVHYDENVGDAVAEEPIVTPVENSVKIAAVIEKKPKVKAISTKKEVAMSDTKKAKDGAKSKVVIEEDICGAPDLAGAEVNYSAQVITVRKKFRYQEGELFRVQAYIKNEGNMPWYSPDSKCIGARVYLGTTRDYDRDSEFYTSPKDVKADSNSWVSPSRIRLDKGQMRVDPGEVASFTFWARADEDPSVYREYFAPVVKDVKWMDEAEFKVDVYSGETDETAQELRKKLLYAYKSMKVDNMKVDGERSVEVDLSDQKLILKIDDYVIREFTVSTGASETPTPKGTFKIFLKNEVRVGHAAPHYIMPRFQMFTAEGAGLHALPSLGNDGGVFWTEALEHIGQPMSHGCVRMLPEDADFAFEFTEVGDEINVHW